MRKLVIGLIAAGVLALAILVVFMLAFPTPKYVYTDTTTPENLTTSIAVGTDEVFVIRLASNPSTGYDWHVATSGPVTFLDWTSVGGGGMPGAPVTVDYRFSSSGQGTGSITLVYERAPPAFATEDIIKIVVISVTVGG